MNLDFYSVCLLFNNYMKFKGYCAKDCLPLDSGVFPTTFTPSGGPNLALQFFNNDSLRKSACINQPVFRYWDVRNVGDWSHLSFFNMLVACSFGETTRIELIRDFHTLFVNYYGVDPDMLIGSYFGGGVVNNLTLSMDMEMQEIYNSLGITSIATCAGLEKECFVANLVEPVGGPRAEIFVDLRDERSPINSFVEFLDLQNRGLIIELFTHVRYDHYVKANGDKLALIPAHKHVDAAGFSPQRLLMVIEGVDKIANISLFGDLRDILQKSTICDPEKETIVCDHIRGLTLLTLQNVVGNLSGRKKRSKRSQLNNYGRSFGSAFSDLGLGDCVLDDLIDESVSMFLPVFPEYERSRDMVHNILKPKIMQYV